MPDSTNDELREQIESTLDGYSFLPGTTHEDKCGFWGTEDGDGKEFCDCTYKRDIAAWDRCAPELIKLIHQHTEQAVLQARIDEQEFMASTFNNKYARTDFGHDKIMDFTREMSKRLESLIGQLATNPKEEQS